MCVLCGGMAFRATDLCSRCGGGGFGRLKCVGAVGDSVILGRNLVDALGAALGMGFRITDGFSSIGNLSDAAEHVALDDAGNGTIQEATYNDVAPWPLAADGTGLMPGTSARFYKGVTRAP